MLVSKQKKFVLLAFAIATLAAGCGKDKTLDEKAQEDATKEFAKAQAAAGTYRGVLTSQSTGQPLGAVEISLQATQVPVQNGGNTGNVVRSVLQGSVTVVAGRVTSSAVITNASFSPTDDSNTNGSVTGAMTVSLGSGGSGTTNATFNLTATLSGASLNGLITPSDRSGTPGSFRVVRDAALPHVGQGQTGPGTPGYTKSFAGSTIDPNCDGASRNHLCPPPGRDGHVTVPVHLTVNENPSSSGYAFVNLFAYLKVVNVHLDIDGAVVPIPSCEFDQRANTLHYQGLISGSTGVQTQSTFDCVGKGAGYSCSYRNESFASSYDFDLGPVNAR